MVESFLLAPRPARSQAYPLNVQILKTAYLTSLPDDILVSIVKHVGLACDARLRFEAPSYPDVHH